MPTNHMLTEIYKNMRKINRVRQLNEALGLSNYKYQIPSDPKQMVYDFYFLSLIGQAESLESEIRKRIWGEWPLEDPKTGEFKALAMAPEGGQFGGYFDQDQIAELIAATKETQDVVMNHTFADVLDATYFACACEIRYMLSRQSIQDILKRMKTDGIDSRSEVGKWFKTYSYAKTIDTSKIIKSYVPEDDVAKRLAIRVDTYKAPGTTGKDIKKELGGEGERIASYAASKKSWDDEEKFFEFCKWAFCNLNWNGSYGGPPWASIADGGIRLSQQAAGSMLEKMIWIDYIFDLEHNTGAALNKVQRYYTDNEGWDWISAALDYKRYSKTPLIDFLDKISPSMKYLAEKITYALTGLAKDNPVRQQLEKDAKNVHIPHGHKKKAPNICAGETPDEAEDDDLGNVLGQPPPSSGPTTATEKKSLWSKLKAGDKITSAKGYSGEIHKIGSTGKPYVKYVNSGNNPIYVKYDLNGTPEDIWKPGSGVQNLGPSAATWGSITPPEIKYKTGDKIKTSKGYTGTIKQIYVNTGNIKVTFEPKIKIGTKKFSTIKFKKDGTPFKILHAIHGAVSTPVKLKKTIGTLEPKSSTGRVPTGLLKTGQKFTTTTGATGKIIYVNNTTQGEGNFYAKMDKDTVKQSIFGKNDDLYVKFESGKPLFVAPTHDIFNYEDSIPETKKVIGNFDSVELSKPEPAGLSYSYPTQVYKTGDNITTSTGLKGEVINTWHNSDGDLKGNVSVKFAKADKNKLGGHNEIIFDKNGKPENTTPSVVKSVGNIGFDTNTEDYVTKNIKIGENITTTTGKIGHVTDTWHTTVNPKNHGHIMVAFPENSIIPYHPFVIFKNTGEPINVKKHGISVSDNDPRMLNVIGKISAAQADTSSDESDIGEEIKFTPKPGDELKTTTGKTLEVTDASKKMIIGNLKSSMGNYWTVAYDPVTGKPTAWDHGKNVTPTSGGLNNFEVFGDLLPEDETKTKNDALISQLQKDDIFGTTKNHKFTVHQVDKNEIIAFNNTYWVKFGSNGVPKSWAPYFSASKIPSAKLYHNANDVNKDYFGDIEPVSIISAKPKIGKMTNQASKAVSSGTISSGTPTDNVITSTLGTFTNLLTTFQVKPVKHTGPAGKGGVNTLVVKAWKPNELSGRTQYTGYLKIKGSHSQSDDMLYYNQGKLPTEKKLYIQTKKGKKYIGPTDDKAIVDKLRMYQTGKTVIIEAGVIANAVIGFNVILDGPVVLINCILDGCKITSKFVIEGKMVGCKPSKNYDIIEDANTGGAPNWNDIIAHGGFSPNEATAEADAAIMNINSGGYAGYKAPKIPYSVV